MKKPTWVRIFLDNKELAGFTTVSCSKFMVFFPYEDKEGIWDNESVSFRDTHCGSLRWEPSSSVVPICQGRIEYTAFNKGPFHCISGKNGLFQL